jgi:thioredoxin-dependent peroxiredoxin
LKLKTLILSSIAAIISALFLFQLMDSTNKIEVGSKVPDFSLFDQDGKLFHISDIIGKCNLVIFFYPKDNTAGCTKEACTFRDMYQDFTDAGADVIGISPDSRESHKGFATSNKLPFTLLSDENKTARNLFGVPTDLFGLIPGRVTYIIDKQGIVRYIFKSQSQVEKHVNESLRILKTLN